MLKTSPPAQNKHANRPKRASGACQNSRKKPTFVSSASARTKIAREPTNHAAIAGTKAPSRSISPNTGLLRQEHAGLQQVGSERLASYHDCGKRLGFFRFASGSRQGERAVTQSARRPSAPGEACP